jgi:hypothetical protein
MRLVLVTVLSMSRLYHFSTVSAICLYKKFLALRPGLVKVQIKMGLAYICLRQPADAVVAFKKALAVDPKGRWAGRARVGLKYLRRK